MNRTFTFRELILFAVSWTIGGLFCVWLDITPWKHLVLDTFDLLSFVVVFAVVEYMFGDKP